MQYTLCIPKINLIEYALEYLLGYPSEYLIECPIAYPIDSDFNAENQEPAV